MAIEIIDNARGEGQGVGGSRQGDGGAVKCVCPDCGYETEHNRGTPCNQMKCPKCGSKLVGK
jgi:predicted Zn-ribbon and HTH transcriptional regulator